MAVGSPRLVSLATGDLELRVSRADLPLDELCGFATRRNTRRGFLFVSRVLGRHLPARPGAMRDVQRRLAARIPADLPGPIVAIGMAETAIAFASGVYDEYVRLTGRDDALFLHTTRFRLPRPLAFEFLEEHSHAADHLVYLPERDEDRALFGSARSLILLDDEASTGKTFLNLARAFARTCPALERVETVVITDWMGPERAAVFHAALPVPAETISLLAGEYRFQPRAPSELLDVPSVDGNGASKDELLRRNDGRLGRRRFSELPENAIRAVQVEPGDRVLVLGTAEFVYPPFQLAELLEARGADVHCQATTRSPILVGNDVACALTFPDNYADGIQNFLYNVRPGQYDRVFICFETPAHTVQPELVRSLGATALLFA